MTASASKSDNIRLRAMEPEDLDLLYRIENDMDLWDVGVTNVPYSRYVLHNYMSSAIGDIYKDRQVRLMIERADGTVVGIVDVIDFNPSHLRAEVGIVIEREHRRCGYACETLRQVADYAQKVLHLHQLYAVADSGNTPSINLFTKMGYKTTATLADWLYDGQSHHDAVVMQLSLR